MDEVTIKHILTCSSVHEIWCKFVSIYEQKSAEICTCNNKSFSDTRNRTEGLRVHVSEIQEMALHLWQAGESVSDQMIITKILMSLPPKYKFFHTSWDLVPSEKQTLN
ncbi:hypothetical protein PR048_017490 [Dryococelus australis]|uniref:Copia protein n=1 Tax=Dryococelus australis TaxID=614101 RepID=A0ABQ9H9Q7_9NEOP|nr:hypothetical protein PR048_017490 [Dryococelus australis]